MVGTMFTFFQRLNLFTNGNVIKNQEITIYKSFFHSLQYKQTACGLDKLRFVPSRFVIVEILPSIAFLILFQCYIFEV